MPSRELLNNKDLRKQRRLSNDRLYVELYAFPIPHKEVLGNGLLNPYGCWGCEGDCMNV